MLDLILKVLKDNDIKEYIINENKEEIYELYMIKKDVDMNRSKNITIYTVTVLKDNGNDLKGSSTVKIYPSMDENEINVVLKDAYFAASFVKNKSYNLPNGYKGEKVYYKNSIYNMELEETACKVKDALYKYDNFEHGWINSSEIFISRTNVRIVTSNDVDASYEKYKIDGEFVTQWVENSDVEIFNMFSCDELKEEELSLKAKEAIINAGYRDKSKEAPTTGNYDLILCDSSVREFFGYYLGNSKTDMIYKKYSNFKLGENVQGTGVKGDKVNIELKSSVPFSKEGIELKNTTLIEDGVLKAIHGPYNFAQYLGIEPIGSFDGAIIKGGSTSEKDMFSDGTLKIIRFSDFQMDDITGDCFGEIRLALLKKGDEIIPLTGGSVTINIEDVKERMLFSKETEDERGVIIPKCIKFKDINVAGK